MNIQNVILHKFAEIKTDNGYFKVYTNGQIERWTDDETNQSEYRWFDEGKYADEDIEAIRQAGLELLK